MSTHSLWSVENRPGSKVDQIMVGRLFLDKTLVGSTPIFGVDHQPYSCSTRSCGAGCGMLYVVCVLCGYVDGGDIHHTPKVWVRYPVHTRYT